MCPVRVACDSRLAALVAALRKPGYLFSAGVRPSSGAAIAASPKPQSPESHVAAPEDGRTPLNTYKSGELSRNGTFAQGRKNDVHPPRVPGFGARLSPAAAATTVRKGLISIEPQLRFGCAAAGDSRAPVFGQHARHSALILVRPEGWERLLSCCFIRYGMEAR